MADPILQDTLTGTLNAPASAPAPLPMPSALQVPTTSGGTDNLKGDIATLQAAQQQPNSLIDFQKVMQLSSSQAYKDRQGKELAVESKAFDPTKVSGGTFGSIISNLEQQRGGDVGKIYSATLNAYASAQEQITNRLQFLQGLKQAQDQFKAEMKLKKSQLKKDNKLEMKKFNQAQSNWEKEFALATQKANKALAENKLYEDLAGSRAVYVSQQGAPASFDPDSY